jgi:hypothetical protein
MSIKQQRIPYFGRFLAVVCLAIFFLLLEERQGRSSRSVPSLLPSFDDISTSVGKPSVRSGTSQTNQAVMIGGEVMDQFSNVSTETAPMQDDVSEVGVNDEATNSLPPLLKNASEQVSTPLVGGDPPKVVNQTNQTPTMIEAEQSSNVGTMPDVPKQEVTAVTNETTTGLPLNQSLHYQPSIEEGNNTEVKNITDDDDAFPFRFCSKTSFPVPRKGTKATSDFKLEYVCNGTEYDEFASVFQNFVRNSSQHHPSTWGRRPHPLPAHKAVVFMGNSHTRQTFTSLICMYAEQIVHGPARPLDRVTSYQFENNSTLYLVFNSPAEASKNWTNRLESLTRRSLQSFDAFVLGQFNKASKLIENTSFYKEMMNQSLYDPDMAFGKVEPPDIIRVAEAFSNPIVFASNFDIGREEMAQSIVRSIDVIQNQTGRTNIQGILSRTYIPDLNGTECGTNDHFQVGKCEQRKTAHRCAGPKGGHPSLIAWDIQEALFSMLEGSEIASQ